MAQGRVGEEGVDRREPGVAGPGAVAAVCLQVLQERGDHRGVEVGEAELGGLLAGLAGGEGEQEPAGVPC